MTQRYRVPEEGLKAVHEAMCTIIPGGTQPDYEHAALEAFIRWQSENPKVPTTEWLDEFNRIGEIKPFKDFRGAMIAAWIGRMYLAEPEVDRIDLYYKTPDGEYKIFQSATPVVAGDDGNYRSPIRCLDCGTFFTGDSCPCKKKPEPEVPEEIADLLLPIAVESGFFKPEVVNERIIEAERRGFIRGQKAGK